MRLLFQKATSPSSPLFVFALVVLAVSLPLIAMQFTSEVNWSLLDFLVMIFLLSSAGLGIQYVTRIKKSKFHKFLLMFSIVVSLILVWLELAVGVFGSPVAGS